MKREVHQDVEVAGYAFRATSVVEIGSRRTAFGVWYWAHLRPTQITIRRGADIQTIDLTPMIRDESENA